MLDNNRVQILLVEDEALIAEDIKDICEIAGYIVAKICYNGHQAISAISNQSFDLAILDINLESELSGFDIADFIRLQNVHLPYIFLTSYSDHKTLNTAKECNPLAYITKPFRKEQLISTIELSLGKSFIGSKNILMDKINPISILTERELEVAKLICEGKSNEEIGNKLCLSVNTIKYHIKNLYEKLQISNRVQLLRLMSN